MSELWKLKGRHPVLWTIPIFVDWIEAHPIRGRFFHAVPLSSFQERAYRDTCRQFADLLPDLQWSVKLIDLERYAEKCDPQDPAILFSWERPQLAQQPQYADPAREDRDEFIDALWQTPGHGCVSRFELERTWRLFCEHMANWLINQEKPVDCYFFKLHLSPYRAGWQDLLHHKFPHLAVKLREADYTEFRRILLSGAWEDLASLDLIALADGTLVRRVEVELKDSWYKQVKKVEYRRRMIDGAPKYAQSVVGSIQRFILTAGRLLVQWSKDSHRPSGADVSGGLHGTYRMLGNLPRYQLRPKRRLKTPAEIDIPADIAPPAPDFLGTDEPLPPLPLLQSPPQDLRDTGPTPPDNHTPGGLLVLSPPQEQNPL
jgi:hypothetical protein